MCDCAGDMLRLVREFFTGEAVDRRMQVAKEAVFAGAERIVGGQWATSFFFVYDCVAHSVSSSLRT